MRKTVILLLSACCLSIAASAAIPVRWSTDAYKVKPLVYECYHGETLDLSAALTAYGDPLDFSGKTARLYWQTNGMATAWWSTNAFVRVEAGATNVLAAIWSGAYDTGAASVTGFIGVEGENYRAAFELRFRASPGFMPNQMPIPPQTIDWAKVANTNVESSPFALKGQGGGVTTNAVKDIVESYGYVTEAVTNGLESAAHATATYQPKGDYLTSESDPTAYAKMTNAVESGYLCTVAAASAMTNDVTLLRYDESASEGEKLKHGDTAVTAADVGALPANQYVEVANGSIGLPNFIYGGSINIRPPAIYLNAWETDYYQLGGEDQDFKWNYVRQGATQGDREIAVKGDILQSNWTETDATSKAYIQNKPDVPTNYLKSATSTATSITVYDQTNGVKSLEVQYDYALRTEAAPASITCVSGEIVSATDINGTLNIVFPAEVANKSADFIVRVVTTGASQLGTLTISGGGTVTPEWLCDALTTTGKIAANKTTIICFSRVAANTYIINAQEVK